MLRTGLLDDRFFLGRRDAILRFSGISDAFPLLFSKAANSPERVLFQFARSNGFSIGPASDFYTVRTFEVNDEKYSLAFKAGLEVQLGRQPTLIAKGSAEARKRACAHIRTPFAHNRCVDGGI